MFIELDGSQGEGGGQILRSALTLSMCTGKPVHIKNIRAKRKSPGLMRQHLTAVQASATICSAKVTGAAIGSTELSFIPNAIKGDDYRFSIGTAGSCTLVLQTILPALLSVDQDSKIELSGGTHNAMSPPFHFLQRAFMPLLQRMGANVDLQLNRFGFYPAGGGEICATIKAGGALAPLHLTDRGNLLNAYAESYFAGLPSEIAERELAVVKQKLAWTDDQLLLRGLAKDQGPGNALLLTLQHEHVTEVFTGFGEKGVSAETVAKKTCAEASNYLASAAAVDTYLADQLLLPMALAGEGSFTTTEWSQHAATNAEVIEMFLPVVIRAEDSGDGVVKVTITTQNLE
jgi:RNA 3'-terminal phosphate cyclase (ATP)